MRYEKIILFRNSENQIISLSYDVNTDYGIFLRECKAKKYSQITISSDMMVRIIEHVCLKKHYCVYRIEFDYQDYDLENEMENILRKSVDNPDYLDVLLNKLDFLVEESTIGIKRVYIRGKYIPDKALDSFFIQSNGIIGIHKESVDVVLPDICAAIADCIQK